MKRQKHIVWVCPGFAADETDTQCIPPLQLLAKELAQQSHICLQIIALHYPYKKAAYQWHGLTIHPCFVKKPFSKSRTRIKAYQKIEQLHRQQKIDFLHSFWLTDAAFITHWKARFLNIPHWVTLAGQDALPTNLYRHILPLSKLNTIAVSNFHAAIWKDTNSLDALKIIPWGIPKIPCNNSPNRPIDILGVGNLIPLKQFDLLIDSIDILKTKHPHLQAVIIGYGPERHSLEQKIKTKGLSKHLRLTGRLPRQEVLAYMEKSKVLFHPSNYESYGFVFVEAMALGLKIVSRPVGIADADADAHWYLGANRTELTSALKEALDNFETPVSRYPYPIEATVRQYLALYEKKITS